MADVKISNLPAASTPLAGTEVLPIVQSTTTKKVAVADLTAGRALSATSLTLTTTPLAVSSGGTGLTSLGTGVATALGVNTGSAGAFVTNGGALGTPSSGTLTNATGLPISSGVSGLGTGIATFLGTPTSANLAAAVTDETGTGALVFGTTPTFTTSALFPAGTFGAPGIAAAGDTDTGIFFPAANTLAFATNGAEDARFDSVGNLLLNSATLSPTQTAGGSIAMTGTLAMGSSFLRNRIINGAMLIDQRMGGAALTHSGTSNFYGIDRWVFNSTGTPQFSVQQVSDAPTGFANSAKLTTTTAGTPAAGDFSYFGQFIEGFNVYDLNFGSASAQSVAISFWVKSSLTGTFGAALRNGANDRAYPFSYAINAANTWEFKSVTIPGDTTGTWAKNNTTGMTLTFDTGSGSNNKATAGAWGSTAAIGVTGGVNLVATAAATWNITGVQLEAGSVATPFERRQYGQELALCQRYLPAFNSTSVTHVISGGYAAVTNSVQMVVPFPVQTRVPPTGISVSSASHIQWAGTGNATASAISFNIAGTLSGSLNLTVTATAGQGGQAYFNTASGQLLFTGCEL